MVTLHTPIEKMPKMSRQIVPALKRLGIHTLQDLLLYAPARYEDFSHIKKIADVKQGDVITVQGIIRTLSAIRIKIGAAIIRASVGDDTGAMNIIWFNQPYLLRTLAVGNTINIAGKAELRKDGMTFQNPSYEKISPHTETRISMPMHTGRLVPIYPETRGITSRWLRYLISTYIMMRYQIDDPLAYNIRKEFNLLELKDAIYALHMPRNLKEAQTAIRRFEFEELLIIQLYALRERINIKQNESPAIFADIALMKQFIGSLSFSLTNAQRRAIWEIMKDMEKPTPMNRLLEGDVGSGKTIVAAAALLLTALASKRACLLAPTEILAQQHAATMSALLQQFNINVGLYTASEKHIPYKSSVFVGTHALLQKNIRVSDLALIIVDEQHRFGVEQRAALIHHHQFTGAHPHFLSMTATPIPRTLALTIYGDLDVSILDEMPKNRKSIITRLIYPAARSEAYEFIRREIKKGHQVFVICPRIEAADDALVPSRAKMNQSLFMMADVKTVIEEHKKLSQIIFPDAEVAMLHGKMKLKEKTAIMNNFRDGAIDILVSTSVIEVGVDVPNATVIMIEGAERFGLAQLHQFRGRVGRGSKQSYCFLFPSERAMPSHRLHALVQAKSGFELAEIDLRLRGPGEFLGTKQSGISSLGMHALANPLLVREVRKTAQNLIIKDPNLISSPLLKKKIDAMTAIVHRE